MHKNEEKWTQEYYKQRSMHYTGRKKITFPKCVFTFVNWFTSLFHKTVAGDGKILCASRWGKYGLSKCSTTHMRRNSMHLQVTFY